MQFAKTEEWPDNIRETDFIFNQSYQYPRPRVRREVDMVTVTLTHLPPNSNIRAQVRVLNKYYAGPPSQVVEFSTQEGGNCVLVLRQSSSSGLFTVFL